MNQSPMYRIYPTVLPAKAKAAMTSQISTAKKKINRTRPRLSCETCSRRRVKCDKRHPACNQCRRTFRNCIYQKETPIEKEMPSFKDKDFRHPTSSRHFDVVQESKHLPSPKSQSVERYKNSSCENLDRSIELQFDSLFSLIQVLYGDHRGGYERNCIEREKCFKRKHQEEYDLIKSDKPGFFQRILDALHSLESVIQDRLQSEKQLLSSCFLLDDCYLRSEYPIPNALGSTLHPGIDGRLAEEFLEATRPTYNISEFYPTGPNRHAAQPDDLRLSAPGTQNSFSFVPSSYYELFSTTVATPHVFRDPKDVAAAPSQSLSSPIYGECGETEANLGWGDWDIFKQRGSVMEGKVMGDILRDFNL